MKNHNLIRFGKVLMLLPCLVFLVNCSKSAKDNSNNNQCYQQQNQYAGGTTYYNPNCNPGNGQYGQQCVGTYWYQGQPVSCFTTGNCRPAPGQPPFILQMNQGGALDQSGQHAVPTQPGANITCQ